MRLASFAGPSIIVSNHPNSLFDALVIAAYCPVEICFLTRGDIFKKPWANLLLRYLFQLPIYKKKDDDEFAVKNDFTFDECMRCLAAGKHVLLFPEGRSLNTWGLQPLMNGGLTSLLERGYRAELPLQIQPFTLNYNSFQHLPKSVELVALAPLDSTDYIAGHQIDTAAIISALRTRLQDSVSEEALVPKVLSERDKSAYRIPAKVGYYTQFWFYRIWRDYIRRKTAGTIFFDSLLFASLLFSYPIFVFFCSVIIGKLFGFWMGIALFVFLPFTAYCMAKYQTITVEKDLTKTKVNRL
ncbi:1-acyl-sn-glycerol-3-phosphate acyltransferase [Sphingobacterium griseoflavum]|uniref:1-acyl-sn-glycerol-3-phosphate acyltransferase n=1 Tax=Sphingobacterium griseoflavum TaxID=1474952 RepID=UPI001674385A|nr:1-acyl-sn-glycerol-3-phosphate acyltransferase [Sphingobacterium griseoflavum]